MRYMFRNAWSFNQPLTFNTSQVTDMTGMFENTEFNQPLTFNTSQVTTMEAMFHQASAFNQDISSWNTSQVTNMEYMFNEASVFNQDISSWDVSKVTNTSYMFLGADAMTYHFPDGEKKTSTCSAKDGPLPSIGPPTILTAVDDDVYRYEWPELWPDFRCVITEDRKDSVYGWLREYGDFFYKTGGNGMSERKVIVVSTPQEIEIKLVYLGNASGICTLAVASVLYAVLDRINKKGHFPTRGKVYIESMNGCRAFNCYDRAFQINGFSLEPKNQYKDVQEYAQNGNGGSGEFMYTLHYKRNKALDRKAAEYHQYIYSSPKVLPQRSRPTTT